MHKMQQMWTILTLIFGTWLALNFAESKPDSQFPLVSLSAHSSAAEKVAESLLDFIRLKQAQVTTQYFPRFTYPPVTWYRQRGIYDSFVHLNFHGKSPRDRLLRNGYRFPDENAFVTLFIVHSLAEVSELVPQWVRGKITDAELKMAVEAIGSHRDQNQANEVPLYGFWNQQATTIFSNQTGRNETRYRCTPVNINVPLSEAAKGLTLLERQLERVNLDGYFKLVGTAAKLATVFSTVFGIPPDSDDTGCNMALGYRLLAMEKQFPESARAWLAANQDPNRGLFDFVKKYSYKPFSEDYVEQSIDPRTYYWIRGFLHEEAKRPEPRLSLITTWMQSIDEVQHQVWYQRMPFSVNNVDASVTVNALFGIASALFARPEVYGPLFDTEMEELFMGNIRLIVYTLENQLVEKYNTLVLLYYPPKFAFYWFVSRLVNLLKSSEQKILASKRQLNETTIRVLNDAAQMLGSAMKDYGVPEILKSVKKDSSYVYWDDFLGNGDKKRDGTPVELFEDRVFSTAMALNALVDIWTHRTDHNDTSAVSLNFESDAPAESIALIFSASNWLVDFADSYPRENAFFSGSIKNGRATPFYFPHNTFKWTNGSSAGICSQYPSSGAIGGFSNLNKLVAAVSGLIPEDEYVEMLKSHKCFGSTFPEDLIGADLNCDGCVFPYWSSPALTESMRLLGLAKMQALK